jgi:hypothetical protein
MVYAPSGGGLLRAGRPDPARCSALPRRRRPQRCHAAASSEHRPTDGLGCWALDGAARPVATPCRGGGAAAAAAALSEGAATLPGPAINPALPRSGAPSADGPADGPGGCAPVAAPGTARTGGAGPRRGAAAAAAAAARPRPAAARRPSAAAPPAAVVNTSDRVH